MKKYHTFWKQGKVQGTYATKSLTDFHFKIHQNPNIEYARTVQTDSSVEWPFGLYTEIIGITDRKNLNRNHPLTKNN